MTAPVPSPSVCAVVLVGGTSRRHGGIDKTAEAVGAHSVLDTLLLELPAHWEVTVVGQQRDTAREVTWTVEDPPRGGPLAGIAAGIATTRAPVTVVLAGDQPFAAAAAGRTVAALLADPDPDVALGLDPQGHVQPLLAAYRTQALRAALPADPRNTRVRSILEHLSAITVELSPRDALDVDTPQDLERARRL